MPIGQLDGLTTLCRAKERVPTLRLVVLSMYADQSHINAALEVGANAYVIKTAHPDDLASAIRQAFDHSIYLAGARVGGRAFARRVGRGEGEGSERSGSSRSSGSSRRDTRTSSSPACSGSPSRR